MCVTVHNSLRVARGLGVVSWSDVLASVADAKAINIMLRDNGVPFNIPSLTGGVLGKRKFPNIVFHVIITLLQQVNNIFPTFMEKQYFL